jgi:hypothetical protein
MPMRFAAERHLMVARPFKAGIETPMINCVAERQLVHDHRQSTPKKFMRRSATLCLSASGLPCFPGVETPGYQRISLREKHHCDSLRSSGVLITCGFSHRLHPAHHTTFPRAAMSHKPAFHRHCVRRLAHSPGWATSSSGRSGISSVSVL